MKFELDYRVLVEDETIDSATLTANLGAHRDALASSMGTAQGVVLVRIDDDCYGEDFVEPIVRLAGLWVRKLPWILGGDTETVAFRNSEHCYAFVPTGESVEFSLFAGSEDEIEEYVVEPINIRIDQFVTQVLQLCEGLLDTIRQINPDLLNTDEDCRDLSASVEEARRAWRERKLHQRR